MGGGEGERAACHSELVADDVAAERLQGERLVRLGG
jgi:hypothetical protein